MSAEWCLTDIYANLIVSFVERKRKLQESIIPLIAIGTSLLSTISLHILVFLVIILQLVVIIQNTVKINFDNNMYRFQNLSEESRENLLWRHERFNKSLEVWASVVFILLCIIQWVRVILGADEAFNGIENTGIIFYYLKLLSYLLFGVPLISFIYMIPIAVFIGIFLIMFSKKCRFFFFIHNNAQILGLKD